MNEPQLTHRWDAILEGMRDCWPPGSWCHVGIVIGCSGGADSVALLQAMSELKERQSNARGFLVAAHFNHALRGDQSDGDEAFVRQLAKRLDLRFESKRGDGTASDEATIRDLRQQFLIDTAKVTGSRYVAVGHTIDDNVETVLHHLVRGTGPAGIAGIAPTRPLDQDLVLIRPLLGAGRKELRDGLREIGQPWREDSSNANTDYRRNWIRHDLVPLIESRFPEAVDAIGRAIEGQRQWRSTIDRQGAEWLESHLTGGDDVAIARDVSADPTIVIAALQQLWDQRKWPRREMARSQWTRLAKTMLGTDSDRYSLPSAIEVLAKGDSVTIRKPN